MVEVRAQFRSSSSREPYMGATAFGCGDHPSLAKRHRWKTIRSGEHEWKQCANCALTKGMADD